MMPHIVIFNQLGVPPIFFKDLKGAAKQKRLKNTDLEGHQISKNKYVGRQQKNWEPMLKGISFFDQVMVMELLSQWGISGFMDHVAKVEEFYRGRRDRMQQAAEKHLTG